jgi:Holliday junction resolvase-like predicted endonuclease
MRNDKNVILLNNLFNGEYVKEKVGGEIINLYQADNGGYYVYVNPYGNIEKKWDNKIKYVLFVRSVRNGYVKVIGKAQIEKQISLNAKFDNKNNKIDPVQKQYIDEHKLMYGGALISSLGSWSKYFITFKATAIHKPKVDIYLSTENNNLNLYENTFELRGVKKIANQSQKLYVENDRQNENYVVLEAIVNQAEFWDEKPVGKVNVDGGIVDNTSFLSIVKKENDELVNSNLLAYFLQSNAQFWASFAKNVLKLTDENIINSKPKITRESIGNIDLFIEVGNCVIVIENKIKSGISGQSSDGYSQLEKYIKKAEEYLNDHSYNSDIKYFLLRPNYNNENYKLYNSGERYSEIKYSEIYNIIKEINGDFYFDELKKVVKKHSAEYDNELYETMNERFIEQIRHNRN